MSVIKDGTGNGKFAKVDSQNRIHTKSVTISEQTSRSLEGGGYNINTGLISLTSGNESAVMYMKYTGVTDFHVSAIAVGVGKLGGTISDPALIKMYRNPTTGTIVDNAVTAGLLNENRNFGSAAALSATIYKGVEGDTFTDGDEIAMFYQNGNGRLFASIDFILTPQTTIGLSITPNATSGGDIYAAFIGHEELADQ